MTFHVQIKTEIDFHKKVNQIEAIGLDENKHLTTKLKETGKLEGRLVTLLKKLVSLLPGVQLARTTPEGVAKVIVQFAKDYTETKDKKWMTDDEKERLEEVLERLKSKIEKTKGKDYLAKHQKGIDDAISILKSLKIEDPGKGKESDETDEGKKTNKGNEADKKKGISFPELKTEEEATDYLFAVIDQGETPETADKIKYVLDLDLIYAHQKNKNGDPAICVAIANGNKAAAMELLNQGADILEPDSSGHYGLYYMLEMAKAGDCDALATILGNYKIETFCSVSKNENYEQYMERCRNEGASKEALDKIESLVLLTR